ncbi:MAG: hypothetical protein K2H23_07270 [Oscillospiraceae bacterium]|nr:hypothetical protein [Oscillospiraceae bacterium]
MKKYIRKHTVYLYLGLISAGVALIMFFMAVLSTLDGERIVVQFTGYASGVLWGIAAFAALYVYYRANRSDMERLDENDRGSGGLPK